MSKLKYIFYIFIGLFVIILGVRLYRVIRSLINLYKILPQYLENKFGSKPKLDLTITLSQVNIRLIFSKEFSSKKEEIERISRNYLEEFYPEINAKRVKIEVITTDTE